MRISVQEQFQLLDRPPPLHSKSSLSTIQQQSVSSKVFHSPTALKERKSSLVGGVGSFRNSWEPNINRDLTSLKQKKVSTLSQSMMLEPKLYHQLLPPIMNEQSKPADRTMRLSSRDWESDPQFIQKLFRYNQIDHQLFNPHIDEKNYRKQFNRQLDVSVPLVYTRPSRKKASVVNFKIEDNLSHLYPAHRRQLGDSSPEVIYDSRFTKDIIYSANDMDIIDSDLKRAKIM